ncbi:glucokinase [Thiomicrorhabdus lithotrophica]|uniref:Glucokinase n=1 Tax=Thiomicrorhabdus lithotrophica TaxID=2949997 RepID=A0ABY8CD24_9GAMM|nr:glucokinase [Thiomicrorhabdus lithotrophica]WEJ63122.1 glucokinase [Thiomicrorhabdus lithotrophica]
MYYLAGDIGGTKALLQLIQLESEESASVNLGQQRYLCGEFDSLESIVSTFLSSFNIPNLIIQSACFGLPGPVKSRQVKLTNLPWIVDADKLEQACSIEVVHFVNDFYAAALGVDTLHERELIPLYLPSEKKFDANEDEYSQALGNRLVIGAGTGLGVAPVYYDGDAYLPQSSEGGHFDFAPISETQQLLLNWLWQKWEHVSYERVLSGPGLEELYRFFLQTKVPNSYSQTNSQNLNKNKLFTKQNKHLGLDFAEVDFEQPPNSLNAQQISLAAEQGDIVAVQALTEFVTIYGAFIGAVALVWNAPSGIYLAGGIAVKIIDWMKLPFFEKAFLEKGRMTKVVASMPVYLVSNEKLGLRGAMRQNQILSNFQT